VELKAFFLNTLYHGMDVIDGFQFSSFHDILYFCSFSNLMFLLYTFYILGLHL
jgi:hypothetical protein